MLSNFEIAAIALLLVNIGLSIYCLSKHSEEKYITYIATRPTTMPPTRPNKTT